MTQRTVDRGHDHETHDQGSRPPAPAHRAYDAFVSYSHAADGRLAPALQAGLQSLAKPWYRRRALRVFRDQTSLSASPELWPAIEEALSQARFFVLLASPESAASHWVDQEVRWWRENRGHDTVLIALTDGELGWDEASGDFDADVGRSRRAFVVGFRASRCGSICAGRETSKTSRCATRAFATASASWRPRCTACRRTS